MSINILSDVKFSGAIDADGHQIDNVLDPTSDQDAATKAYVDSVAGGGGPPTGSAGGELSGTYPNPTLVNASVIGKVLTGFSSGAGTVSASDSILSAFNKIVGNIAALIPLSLANMANVATSTVFYRKTAGTGSPEVQALATLATDIGALDTDNGPVPTGTIILSGHPMGIGGLLPNLQGRWLVCNGQAVSRTTYATLFNRLTRETTVTGVDLVNNEFDGSFQGSTGDPIYLTTTGTLPTGVSPNTIYYAIISGISIKVATSRANARLGTAIDLSGSPSGAHKIVECPWGLGDGSTTFNLPNLKGKVVVGIDPSDTDFDLIGLTGGAKTHTLTTAELASHNHTQDSHNHTQNAHSHASTVRGAVTGSDNTDYTGLSTSNDPSSTAIGAPAAATAANIATTATNQAAGGGSAHNNLQPYVSLMYLIKY